MISATIKLYRGAMFCKECGGNMRRDARVCEDNATHTAFDFVDGEMEIEVEVEGNFRGGERGDHETPGMGDTVEDIEATVGGKSFVLGESEYEDAIEGLLDA